MHKHRYDYRNRTIEFHSICFDTSGGSACVKPLFFFRSVIIGLCDGGRLLRPDGTLPDREYVVALAGERCNAVTLPGDVSLFDCPS